MQRCTLHSRSIYDMDGLLANARIYNDFGGQAKYTFDSFEVCVVQVAAQGIVEDCQAYPADPTSLELTVCNVPCDYGVDEPLYRSPEGQSFARAAASAFQNSFGCYCVACSSFFSFENALSLLLAARNMSCPTIFFSGLMDGSLMVASAAPHKSLLFPDLTGYATLF
jgi:hypothetical protein